MNRIEEKWLSSISWQDVIHTNENFCKEKELPHRLKGNHSAVQKLWESRAGQSQRLEDAIGLCFKCRESDPFEFYNQKTFAAIGTSMIEGGLQRLPPPEARILRNSVGHYIAGTVKRKELDEVLKHFDALWKKHASGPGSNLPPKANPSGQLPPRPGN